MGSLLPLWVKKVGGTKRYCLVPQCFRASEIHVSGLDKLQRTPIGLQFWRNKLELGNMQYVSRAAQTRSYVKLILAPNIYTQDLVITLLTNH